MRTLLAAAVLAASAAAAIAGDKKGSGPPDAATMKAWAEFATPGEGHKRLEAFIGSWKTRTKFWPKPGAPAMESDGTAEIKWVLGGRYIEQRVEGRMMGQSFSGLGHTGFDNIKKKYVSTWMDTFGTSILQTWGKAEGMAIKSEGTADDVSTRKPMKYRDAVTPVDADTFTYEAWQPEPGGKSAKLYRAMEIVYTRAK
ncbi:MAG: DUF1579 domain-containing protein [Proteobacteria bacterium]|nr:DUF1579 domain-containing protein [Pseudomonadota bacterium]